MNDDMQRNRSLNHPSIKEFFKFAGIDLKNHFNGKKKVLEIGCGNAILSMDLKKINEKLDIYCLDRRKPDNYDEMINMGIKFIQVDLDKVDESILKTLRNFDIIFSFRTYMHLNLMTKINVTNLIFKMLKNKGFAFIDYCGNFYNGKHRASWLLDDDNLIKKINLIDDISIGISDLHRYGFYEELFEPEELIQISDEEKQYGLFDGKVMIIRKEKENIFKKFKYWKRSKK